MRRFRKTAVCLVVLAMIIGTIVIYPVLQEQVLGQCGSTCNSTPCTYCCYDCSINGVRFWNVYGGGTCHFAPPPFVNECLGAHIIVWCNIYCP
jgi:hypothetical protein